VWQEVREELRPQGLEVVTIALDVGGAGVAGHFIDRANAQHPSLIDEAHLLDELYGVVNVPSGIWIDEEGVVVRPPEPAWPGRAVFQEFIPKELPPDADPWVVKALALTKRIRHNPAAYMAALRDWAATGAASRYALPPDEVVARSRPRPISSAEAAAQFELGQHLHRAGFGDDAVPHFREAHRLEPDNWTYKRQAWRFEADAADGDPKRYDSNWSKDVRKIGPENYYPKIDA
jgi:hypothetical protein